METNVEFFSCGERKMKKSKKLLALLLAVLLAVSALALPASAAGAGSIGTRYPTVFVHGLMGWGSYDRINDIVPYWGMGTPNFKIVTKVLVPESRPALIVGAVISTVTILGYSAMAGTIGGGGLGQIAINYGYQRYNNDIIWVCVILTVIIVQIIQEVGMLIVRKTDRRVG